MAASAATAYDPTQDAGGSENSDVELDAEHQPLSQLPMQMTLVAWLCGAAWLWGSATSPLL